jgi:hypothetical protein
MIDGEEYSFGVSGKLIMNVLVMCDRQTDSLWSQLLGEAVDGPLTGTKLEFVPSWQTTWSDWKTRHPDTIALDKGFAGRNDPYTGYYNSSSSGVLGQSRFDDRLYVKEFVIGVEQNGDSVAYPYGLLNDIPVVNDIVGETPVLVVFNPDTGSGWVFERRLNGQILTFSQTDGLGLIDAETGTIWDGLTGQATEGPLADKTLTRMKSTASFWFGWKDWYPDTRIYSAEE